MDDKMLVSIIIPYSGNNQEIVKLKEDISGQEVSFCTEIISVPNIKPAGKARNTGARQAKGEVFIFLDSDIKFANKSVLENLIKALSGDRAIGVVSSSIRIPLDASAFQVRYTKQIPNCQTPIVEKITDVGVATSACCAITKEVFFTVGGFNENILRGQDPEFSYRLRKTGFRTVLATGTWCYHAQPDNLAELISIHFRNGMAVAFVDKFYPELNIDVDPRGIIYSSERKSKFYRAARYLAAFFMSVFQGKFLLLSAKTVYMLGYFKGRLVPER
jgi:cellulose synthase/poly-beta-1,6-N-acetylglucosamine synthase-like glycosyltransferase